MDDIIIIYLCLGVLSTFFIIKLFKNKKEIIPIDKKEIIRKKRAEKIEYWKQKELEYKYKQNNDNSNISTYK